MDVIGYFVQQAGGSTKNTRKHAVYLDSVRKEPRRAEFAVAGMLSSSVPCCSRSVSDSSSISASAGMSLGMVGKKCE